MRQQALVLGMVISRPWTCTVAGRGAGLGCLFSLAGAVEVGDLASGVVLVMVSGPLFCFFDAVMLLGMLSRMGRRDRERRPDEDLSHFVIWIRGVQFIAWLPPWGKSPE